jgi:hypothetical protein
MILFYFQKHISRPGVFDRLSKCGPLETLFAVDEPILLHAQGALGSSKAMASKTTEKLLSIG